jgi:hypothetical protein
MSKRHFSQQVAIYFLIYSPPTIKLYLLPIKPIFTDDLKHAMLYAVGFDNPEIKLGIWNAEAKKLFNTGEVKFELIYL